MKLSKVRYALLFMTLVSVATAEEKATCHESSRYLIAEGSTGQVGTNFLVKYKRQKGKPPVCKYVVNPGDFEIPNEEGQDGDHLTGYHCGVTEDAGRTDTVPDGEGEPSIKGRIKGDTATVDVHSAYSGAVVRVRLVRNGQNLEWKMAEVKKRGEYYFPDTKQTLRRCHFDATKKDWVKD